MNGRLDTSPKQLPRQNVGSKSLLFFINKWIITLTIGIISDKLNVFPFSKYTIILNHFKF